MLLRNSSSSEQSPVTDSELKDYKFMCFNGKVKCSFICSERFSKDGLKVTFFDRDWNKMPFIRKYPSYSVELHKPDNYETLVGLAETLARNFSFIRVDFYESHGQIYFGELTSYPESGFEPFTPEEWDSILGKWLKLPQYKENIYLEIDERFQLSFLWKIRLLR